MAKRSYALERGGPKVLGLRWGGEMRDFEVTLGAATWKLDRAALAAGATLALPDGSSLLVKKPDRAWYMLFESRNALIVECDGVPVPGSDGEPRVLGRRVGGLILLFGLARSVGLAVLVAQPGVQSLARSFLVVAAEGAILVALGILAVAGRRLPVGLAAGLMSVEVLFTLVWGVAPHPLGVLFEMLVIVHLARGWSRMRPRERRPSLAQVFD